mgnify:CR=1 FL=1
MVFCPLKRVEIKVNEKNLEIFKNPHNKNFEEDATLQKNQNVMYKIVFDYLFNYATKFSKICLENSN